MNGLGIHVLEHSGEQQDDLLPSLPASASQFEPVNALETKTSNYSSAVSLAQIPLDSSTSGIDLSEIKVTTPTFDESPTFETKIDTDRTLSKRFRTSFAKLRIQSKVVPAHETDDLHTIKRMRSGLLRKWMSHDNNVTGYDTPLSQTELKLKSSPTLITQTINVPSRSSSPSFHTTASPSATNTDLKGFETSPVISVNEKFIGATSATATQSTSQNTNERVFVNIFDEIQFWKKLRSDKERGFEITESRLKSSGWSSSQDIEELRKHKEASLHIYDEKIKSLEERLQGD
ncbi:BA75_02871T0 [Komagataella pastoris]|uniref:BA75_02871T0 n=1 Tax=Komagataella pastoris TaxID=4922 RepID=A0A1B2JBN6_PICPA|nr:BA75_02871T0 [Komagataella pastoris]